MVFRGLDAQAEVVEQRPLALARVALLEQDRRVAGPEEPVLDVEAELGEPREGGGRIGDAEGDVVEVVGDALVDLDKGEPEALRPPRARRPSTRSTATSGGNAASASSRSKTRSPIRASTPGSRGPCSAKSVSFPWRASEPTSVNLSVRSMTCMPA